MKKLCTILLISLSLVNLNAQTSLTTAVDFTVTDVHGETHNLFSLLNEGKYVIVDFFFTTCGPCISSVPTLNQSFTDYGCNTGEVFYISIDDGDTDAEVLQYENDYGGLLPSVSGIEGGGNVVNSAYGISAYPTVILIAPDQTILEQDIYPVSNITTALPNAGLNMAVCDTGSSTAITEIVLEKERKENRIFDIFGREWERSYADLPKGVYIIDKKKVLKTD
ncbi:MAG: TlpA family protein disulfide reductase [Flavobacteriales bacterium]